jgi:serine/threonine protein kinase
MSPELLDPEKPGYSFENDIWAVEIAMLFGLEPFNAKTKESIVMNIRKACLQFPEEFLVSKAFLITYLIEFSMSLEKRPSIEQKNPFFSQIRSY